MIITDKARQFIQTNKNISSVYMYQKNDEPAVYDYFGDTSFKRYSPLNEPKKIFRIASLTKMFTAALVLKLASEGILSLTDKLSDWINIIIENKGKTVSFLRKYINPSNKDATLANVLNHTAGLPDYESNRLLFERIYQDYSKIWSTFDFLSLDLNIIREGIPLNREGYPSKFGKFSYSNSGYLILQLIIDLLPQSKGFKGEMIEKIILPLGLTSTFFGDDIVSKNLLNSYDYFKDTSERWTLIPSCDIKNDIIQADGCLYSNLEDLSKFIRCFSKGFGENEEKNILFGKSLIEEMKNAGAEIIFNHQKYFYNYGHRRFNHGNGLIIAHAGYIYGYDSYIQINKATEEVYGYINCNDNCVKNIVKEILTEISPRYNQVHNQKLLFYMNFFEKDRLKSQDEEWMTALEQRLTSLLFDIASDSLQLTKREQIRLMFENNQINKNIIKEKLDLPND